MAAFGTGSKDDAPLFLAPRARPRGGWPELGPSPEHPSAGPTISAHIVVGQVSCRRLDRTRRRRQARRDDSAGDGVARSR
jgi:hypothetical protein